MVYECRREGGGGIGSKREVEGGGGAGGGEKGVANILSYDQVLFVLSGPSVVDRTFNANFLPPPPRQAGV